MHPELFDGSSCAAVLEQALMPTPWSQRLWPTNLTRFGAFWVVLAAILKLVLS
jgi:hypothetical protein